MKARALPASTVRSRCFHFFDFHGLAQNSRIPSIWVGAWSARQNMEAGAPPIASRPSRSLMDMSVLTYARQKGL
jgi:hypothetical protein